LLQCYSTITAGSSHFDLYVAASERIHLDAV